MARQDNQMDTDPIYLCVSFSSSWNNCHPSLEIWVQWRLLPLFYLLSPWLNIHPSQFTINIIIHFHSILSSNHLLLYSIQSHLSWGEHPELFAACAEGADDIERMLSVLRWFIGTLKPQYMARNEKMGMEKKVSLWFSRLLKQSEEMAAWKRW